jgi:hypothetical protein
MICSTAFFAFYHTLKDCDVLWIESQQPSVKRSAKKMPLALAEASVMVWSLRKGASVFDSEEGSSGIGHADVADRSAVTIFDAQYAGY